uniref:DUF5702 domain-containing protein n=1 Tax=Agathobacter sp. TaxID=2021311 RepID=UPI004056719E
MKKNRRYKKRKTVLYRYINGTRGAVSLLMALIMSPLLSISLLVVESARYQNAVELTEEIIDSAVFSSLADYDSYIEQRFGLLSISQENDLNRTFSDLIDTNINLLGDSVTVSSKQAKGQYSLADVDILRQQILEFGEITVASEVIWEGLDFSELIDKLKKTLKIDAIEKQVDEVNEMIDLTKSVVVLIENLSSLSSSCADYVRKLNDYKSAASRFESKVVSLADTLESVEEKIRRENLEEVEEAKRAQEENETGEEIEEVRVLTDSEVKALVKKNSKVRNAVSAANSEKETYKSKANILSEKIKKIKNEVTETLDAFQKISVKISETAVKAKEDSEANSGEDGSKEVQKALNDSVTDSSDYVSMLVEQVIHTVKNAIGDNFGTRADNEVNRLQKQVTALSDFSANSVTKHWSSETVKNRYGVLSISAVPLNLRDIIEDLITELNKKEAATEESVSCIGNMIDTFYALMNLSGLYDDSLNAQVSNAKLHRSVGMSVSSKALITSGITLAKAGKSYTDAVSSISLIRKAVNTLKAIISLLQSVVSFLVSLVAWAAELVASIVGSWFDETTFYEEMLLYGYGIYNFPNRTTYEKGKTLAGYKYSKIAELAGWRNTNTSGGSLASFQISGNVQGNDSMFKGAEAEYLFAGSNSEVMNQSVVFMNIYLFRLVLDIIPVLKNEEVTAISAAAGPAAILVKVLVAMIEPLLETFVLVNGGKAHVINDVIYLTPSGASQLALDFTDLTDVLTSDIKKKIKDSIKGSVKPSANTTRLADASYSEHLLLLMLLKSNETVYLKRIQNIIQMETACYYRNDYSFDLDKSFSYVEGNISYRLNPMFDMDSLSEIGLFQIKSKRIAGY